MNQLLSGALWGLIAQILTFLQLQGNIRYGWYERYPLIILGVSIPVSWMYIKSVEALVKYYNGELWPSRLIGFCIGIIVFGLMSKFLFGETLSMKTIVCLILAATILLIQLYWK